MDGDKDWVQCFWENIQEFIQFLNDLFEELFQNNITTINPFLVKTAGAIVLQWDRNYLIDSFICRSHGEWEKILEGDVDYFAGNAFNFFGGLSDETIKIFQRLFTETRDDGTSVIEIDDMDAIIDFFRAFVRCSIHYIHNMRVPITFEYRSYDGAKIFKYQYNDVYPGVILEDLPEKWDVNLKNPS